MKFKPGQYYYTWYDNGIGMTTVFCRVVKVTPKMVIIRGEDCKNTKRWMQSYFKANYSRVGPSDWHPQIPLGEE
jgi:hypothetical protein